MLRAVAAAFFAAALLLLMLLPSSGARADDFDGLPAPEHMIRVRSWGRWTKGFDLGARAFGKFTSGANLDAQPGNVFAHSGAHIWWNHLVEAHASLGVGFPNTTFELGFGFKFNLLEFIEDPTAELISRGIQRGLLAKVLQNFMFYASVDVIHYSFPTPDPSLGLTYQTSLWTLQPGLGAQWYFFLPTQFAQRWYIDTSISFTVINSNKYVAPYVGVGFELSR